jgi:hypothetical protein
MTVSSTSRAAYTKIQGMLGQRQMQVYDAISDLGIGTNEMISDYLNWPINRVTGRVTELKRYGLIDVEGLGKNKSGFTAKLWGVRDLNDKKLLEIANDCEA